MAAKEKRAPAIPGALSALDLLDTPLRREHRSGQYIKDKSRVKG